MPDSKMNAQVLEPESPVTMRVDNISKNFGSFKAITQVSFQVRRGEVLGFLGPNGAGKTTTMRILTGFFPPSSGKVWIEGQEFFKKPRESKQRIGYLPESVSLYEDMRVFEFLELVAKIKGVERKKRLHHIEEKLERCGLFDVRKKMIGYLSKGYRQRVGLAQALIGDPSVLILDEPTNGLDPKQIIEIRALIRELGRERTLILSTHILPEVSMVCDRVLIMNKGKVVASGTTDELEAGLSKGQQVFVSIGDRYRKDETSELLKALPGVEDVKLVQEKEDQASFALRVGKDQDLRPAISRLFVQHQIPLLEIRTGRLSLEEIYLQIVVSEGDELKDKK
jgi:ABC-2 type transport system ATP-binding protein